ncbi:MAG: putative lipid II flippase FtsW [Acidobacteriota bacterium]|jgi:cell division protein FtsW|nr:putative lipid II flippase FtsW [Acidobacteriota bacterium]
MAYRPSSDKILLSVVGFLTVLGLLMVYSASSVHAADKHGDSYYFFLRQLKFAGFGFLALLGLMHIDYHFFQKPKVLCAIMALSGAALIFVLTQPVVNGARRWIFISGVSIQPSEFAKIAILIFIAWFLQTYGKTLNRLEHIAAICLCIALFAGLVGVEPDLGQAFTICFVAAILLVMAGLSWRYIAGAIIAAIPMFYLFVYNVDYRWKRIGVFLNPESGQADAAFQINQSLIAVGSGGLLGLGPGDSKQKLFFLPESSTDFIFAIICEEWGFIGAVLVVAAFLVFFYRGMKIASKSQDKFGFYLGAGITLMVTLQGFINITMVLGMMPTKGIALPFISQGGSSLLMNLAATGILLNLSYQNKLVEAVE